MGSGAARRHRHTLRAGRAPAPGIALEALILLFGAYALVDGVFAIVGIFGHRSGTPRWLLIEGVAGILAGLIAFVMPQLTAILLLYLIAAWAIVTGISEIATAIRLRKEIRGEWAVIAGGVLSVLFGVLLAVIGPVAGLFSLIWLIGIYAVAFGIMLLIAGFRVRSEQGGGTRQAEQGRGGIETRPVSIPPSTNRIKVSSGRGSRPPVRWPGLPAGAWLGEVVAHELDADGEPLREASRDAYGRDAGEVSGDGAKVVGVHGEGVVHLLPDPERHRGCCRREQRRSGRRPPGSPRLSWSEPSAPGRSRRRSSPKTGRRCRA